MKIGELARRTGVTTDTLRFYEARGLLQAERWPNGYRDFAERTVSLVGLIRLAQSLGFSLGEIGDILTQLGADISSSDVAELLREKLAEIDTRLAALTQLRTLVATRIEQACPLGLT